MGKKEEPKNSPHALVRLECKLLNAPSIVLPIHNGFEAEVSKGSVATYSGIPLLNAPRNNRRIWLEYLRQVDRNGVLKLQIPPDR